MALAIVSVFGGEGGLGSWGKLRLVGPKSAVLVLEKRGEEIALTDETSADLPGAGIVFDEATGRLVCFPYTSSEVLGFDLAKGIALFDPIIMRRNPDRGLRSAGVRVLPDRGVLYISESDLMLFDKVLSLVWHQTDNFGGWMIDDVTASAVRLRSADWKGNEEIQVRSLEDGSTRA